MLAQALALGAIDEGSQDVLKALAGADLVILATPVGEILRLLPLLKGAVSEKTLVTDVGSTKLQICECAREVLGAEALFLGGHPLAGKERSGIENADPNLFENAVYSITPLRREHLEHPCVKAFCSLLRSCGAQALVMDAAAHDAAVAWLSHLPQLLSTALASLVVEKEELPLELAASGFRDMTRLAESPYTLWRDIYATNLANIEQAIDAMISKLETLRNHLSSEALEREFRQALELREKLRARG